MGGRWLVAASLEKICYYFWGFSHFHFAECKFLPSAFPALSKGFVECPTKSTRQIAVCRQKDAVCCMPSVTLDKTVAECFWAFAECPWHSANLLYPVVQYEVKTISLLPTELNSNKKIKHARDLATITTTA